MANFIPIFNRPFLYIEYSILYHKYVILYCIYSILTSKYQIKTFLKNQPSSLGYYFYKIEAFFQNFIFFLIFAKPLYQNVRIDHRIAFFFFVNTNENYKSYLGFGGFLGFSISQFILIIYKGNRFGNPTGNTQ